MMLAVRRGEIDVVAVWRWDRLFRSLQHMVETLQEGEAKMEREGEKRRERRLRSGMGIPAVGRNQVR